MKRDEGNAAVLDSPASAHAASGTPLGRAAVAFRAAHAAFAIVQLASLGYVWASAVTGRRDRALSIATGLLLVEGGALVVGRGDCPLGPFQRKLGDPVPLFALVLPTRAAKAAVPVLAAIAIAGLAALAIRPAHERGSPGS